MIALYMINSNNIVTDAHGDDIQWLREQADQEYGPKITTVTRLTVTHRMPNYAQATITYPKVDKPVFLTYCGAYAIFERKETL